MVVVRHVDAVLEPLSRKRLTLSEWYDELNELLRGIIPDGGEEDRLYAEAVFRHIRWRLRLPKDSLQWVPDQQQGGFTEYPFKVFIPTQYYCFFESFGIQEELCQNPLWRECLSLRYDHDQIAPIEWMSAELKCGLDSLASDLKERGITDDIPREYVDRIDRLVEDSDCRTLLRIYVAWYYVMSKLGSPTSNVFRRMLESPVTDGEFFAVIGTKRCVTPQDPHDLLPNVQPDGESFVRYLNIPDGHERELAGRVLYYVMRLEEGVDDKFVTAIPGTMSRIWLGMRYGEVYAPRADFDAYSDALGNALEIGPEVFARIFSYYVSLLVGRSWSWEDGADGVLFWAARIAEALDPDRCRIYRDRIRDIQSQIRSATKPEVKAPGSNVELEWQLLRTALGADPLLNCIFHSDVLGGQEVIEQRKNRPLVDSGVINATLAYAALQLKAVCSGHPRASIVEVLERCPRIKDQMGALGDESYWKDSVEAVDVGPASRFTFLTPIAIILFRGTDALFTPSRVKERCLEHEMDPDSGVNSVKTGWHKANLSTAGIPRINQPS